MKKIKIKNDINLKILEKYGYEDYGDYYAKLVMRDNYSKVWTWHESIIIRKDDRIIRTKITRDTVDEEWFGYVVSKDHFIYDLLDYIEEIIDKEDIVEES